MTTTELLSEGVDAARKREKAAFEGLRAGGAAKVVLFGAGRLGRKVAAALHGGGIAPVAFADNDTRLAGTSVEGVPVLSLEDAARQHGREALFVVTTFLPVGGGV